MQPAGQEPRPLPPRVLRKRIGLTLRGLRNGLDISIDAFAREADVSASSMSRVETGVYSMTRRDFRAVLKTLQALYKAKRQPDAVPDELIDELTELRALATRRGGWYSKVGSYAPSWLADYVELEMSANEIDTFCLIIPGLLQTESYARAVIGQGDRSSDGVDRLVEIRLARQEHLAKYTPALRVILDESALHRRVASNEVMREQLRHLADMAGQRWVHLRVAPYEAGLVTTSIGGSFTILRNDYTPPSVYVESPDIGTHIEGERVDGFAQKFEKLLGVALGVRESKQRLRAIAEAYS